MDKKYFVGYENSHWFIQETSSYRINEHGDYVTNKGTFSPETTKYTNKQVFNTMEGANDSIKDSEKGYIIRLH